MNQTEVKVNDRNAARREKRTARNKLFKKKKGKSWRKRKAERRLAREEKLLKQLKVDNQIAINKEEICSPSMENSEKPLRSQCKFYTLAIALPGSILNNAQSPELRTYLAGQIARSAAVFCVDEVVVYDETARMTSEQRESYYLGTWRAEKRMSEDNIECNFHLARILEYLECPQYLRKALFPMQNALKFSGVLNPLDCTHHLRSTDFSIPYREGVVLDKPVKKGRGPFCDVGLDKELQIESEINLPPNTRVTVHLTNTEPGAKRYRGEIVSPKRVRSELGLYWGYNVRIAQSLSDVVNGNIYDVVIGTSEKGQPIKQFQLPLCEKYRILLVFGGLDGLEAAVDADESITSNDPAEFFEHYVNSVPDQGSRTIRTEEAIPITLAALKLNLDSDNLS